MRGSVGRVIVLPNGITLIYNEEGEWWAYYQGQMVSIPPNWSITIVPGKGLGPLVQGQYPQPNNPQDNGEGYYPDGNNAGGQVGAPVAQFTANVIYGIAPLAVQFTDQSTGSITGWSWDFGDGVSDERNPVHTYVGPGIYTVALTVSGPDGLNTLIKTDYIVVWGSWTQTTATDFNTGTTDNTIVLNVGGGDGSIVLTINVPSIEPDQLPSSFTNDFWYSVYSSNYQAQTFCAGISGGLVRVDIQLRAAGSPAPLIIELRNSDVFVENYVPGNTVLGSAILPAVPSEGVYSVLFSPLTGITADQHYAIVVYQQGNGGTEEDNYEWGGTGGDYYNSGDAFWSDDAGASWQFQTIGSIPEDHYFETYVGQYYANGAFESSSYDCGSGATFGNILWEYNSLDSAVVKFQVATNNDDSTWNFVGPDGTSSTFYDISETALWSGHNGDRYIKCVTIYYR